MKLDTIQRANEIVDKALNGHVRNARYSTSRTTTDTVVMGVGVTEYQFSKGADGNWRLIYVNTYGNTSGVYGTVCDASGFVVSMLDAQILNDVLQAHAR